MENYQELLLDLHRRADKELRRAEKRRLQEESGNPVDYDAWINKLHRRALKELVKMDRRSLLPGVPSRP